MHPCLKFEIITVTDISDDQIIKIYERYLKDIDRDTNHSPANKDMGFIAKSAFPLFLLMILAVVVIIIFPNIALWLPEQMIQPLK